MTEKTSPNSLGNSSSPILGNSNFFSTSSSNTVDSILIQNNNNIQCKLSPSLFHSGTLQPKNSSPKLTNMNKFETFQQEEIREEMQTSFPNSSNQTNQSFRDYEGTENPSKKLKTNSNTTVPVSHLHFASSSPSLTQTSSTENLDDETPLLRKRKNSEITNLSVRIIIFYSISFTLFNLLQENEMESIIKTLKNYEKEIESLKARV